MTHEIVLHADGAPLPAALTLPAEPRGLVIFVHGSGSSRLSPRNQAVAMHLVERGCATLLFDLLTESESQDRANVFDIPLLTTRIAAATDAMHSRQDARGLPIGYFGASTGAAAALVASTASARFVAAVVSRGGRPDLAASSLPLVTAPTLLIVGSLDTEVLVLNRLAQQQMTCACRLEIIEGATHLFEEPGTLDHAAREAGDWFVRQFDASITPRAGDASR